jgi:hypothetical protein
MPLVLNSSSITGLASSGGFSSRQTGEVLQVVQGTSTASVTTSVTGFVTTGLTASITPLFSTSKILITVTGGDWDTNAAGYQILGTVYRNSTNLGGGTNFCLTDVYSASTRSIFPVSIQYLDSPATTSSTSYTLYFNSAGGTNTVKYNTQNGIGIITLMEIAA